MIDNRHENQFLPLLKQKVFQKKNVSKNVAQEFWSQVQILKIPTD